VKQALERLAGVTVIAVDRTKNEARVSLEGPAVTIDQMVAAIQGAGRFQARMAAG
jgi:copper chaperone CopZ